MNGKDGGKWRPGENEVEEGVVDKWGWGGVGGVRSERKGLCE